MKQTDPQNLQNIACCLSKNIQLLQKLLTGPKYKSELADVLGVSKSTVYYRFKNLEEIHFVERGSDGYQITTTGRKATETYLEAIEKVESIYTARELLQEMPSETVPPRETLAEADTVLPDRHPEQLWTTFCEWVLTAEVARGVMPCASCTFIETLQKKKRRTTSHSN